MKIKAIIYAIHSNPDTWGNCSWAFRFVDTKTGKRVFGKTNGGESNIHAILWEMGLDCREVELITQSFPIRRFSGITEGWEYAGCSPSQISEFVKRELKKRIKK